MPTHTELPIIPVTRWKRIAETPLTGNPIVDNGIIEDLRTALRLACAHIEQTKIEARTELTTALTKAAVWKSKAEFWEKKNQRLQKNCALTDQ